jgi:hypothetical protein
MQRSTLLAVAGILTVLSSLIMVYYGLGFLSAYIGSINYYHTRIFEPALYIGIWNCFAFPFTLTGGIFLLRKKYFRFSIFGLLVALVSGFVPTITFAVIHGYESNGLSLGAPLLFLSLFSLTLLAISKR